MTVPGAAAAINEDGTVNSLQNPAEVNSVVSLYATGIGTLDPTPLDGAITQLPLPRQTNQIEVRFNMMSGELLYAGPAPFEVSGLTQINVRAQPGPIQLRVTAPDGTLAQVAGFSIATKTRR